VLSTSEDIAAAGVTWLATVHPYLSAGIVVAALLIMVLLVRKIVAGVRGVWAKLRGRAPAVQESSAIVRAG